MVHRHSENTRRLSQCCFIVGTVSHKAISDIANGVRFDQFYPKMLEIRF